MNELHSSGQGGQRSNSWRNAVSAILKPLEQHVMVHKDDSL